MHDRMEDKDAIRELIAEYCFRIDGADWDGWAALFTEDGAFEVTGMFEHRGRETLSAFAKTIPLNDHGLPGFKHCTMNQVISVDGDAATAKCYFLLVAEGAPLRVDIAGRYEDRLARDRGGWRFAKRTATFDLAALPKR